MVKKFQLCIVQIWAVILALLSTSLETSVVTYIKWEEEIKVVRIKCGNV